MVSRPSILSKLSTGGDSEQSRVQANQSSNLGDPRPLLSVPPTLSNPSPCLIVEKHGPPKCI